MYMEVCVKIAITVADPENLFGGCGVIWLKATNVMFCFVVVFLFVCFVFVFKFICSYYYYYFIFFCLFGVFLVVFFYIYRKIERGCGTHLADVRTSFGPIWSKFSNLSHDFASVIFIGGYGFLRSSLYVFRATDGSAFTGPDGSRSGQVRSECLTCTFRASCCSARLSQAQLPAGSSVLDRKRWLQS